MLDASERNELAEIEPTWFFCYLANFPIDVDESLK